MRWTWMLLLTASLSPAAERPEYLCPFVDQPPVLDAAVDDAVWQQAPVPPTFTSLGISEEPAPARTRLWMLAGPDALYIGVDAQSRPGEMPDAVERERDQGACGDDSIELHISPDPNAERYYWLAINAAGAYQDRLFDTGLTPEEQGAWDPDWRRAARMREGGWSAEIAIPWGAFGLAERPAKGHIWRIRVGRNAKAYGYSMWPNNPSPGFHDQSTYAWIVFEDANLLANPGFEEPLGNNGRPPGWNFIRRDEPGFGEGTIEVIEGDAPEGQRFLRYEKTDDVKWYPQVQTQPVPVQGGSVYEFSMLVNASEQFPMRWFMHGPDAGKRAVLQEPTDGWERRSVEVRLTSGVERLSLGFQLSQTTGVVMVDDVRLVRRNEVVLAEAELPTPHRYHGLEELVSRSRFKPYALLQREDGSFQPDRVIFTDTSTGTEIWLMTRSAEQQTRHVYMEMSPWNADGSVLALNTSQFGPKNTILMPADGSSWRECPGGYKSGYQWDRLDPNRLYWRDYLAPKQFDLAVFELDTGESRTITEFGQDISIWPMSQDGKYLLIRHSHPDPGNFHDVTAEFMLVTGEGNVEITMDPGHHVHQCWFSKRDDYSVEFNYEWAREVGLEGAWMIWPDRGPEKVADPHWSHRAHSPDGEWVAPGGPARIVRWDGSEVIPIAGISTTHNTWRTDPAWWCASSGRYMVRIAADGRDFVQRLGAHNSRLDKSTYSAEAHPEMSADGTKVGYASNMLHDIEFYSMVIAQPGAPRGITARPDGDRLAISWESAQYAKEVAGYLIYRSAVSGEPGEQIMRSPVTDTSFIADAPAGGPWYYTVAAVEASGLEGMRSAEVCSDPTWPGPIRHYFEAEAGTYARPANEVFDARAAGMYALTLGPGEPATDPVTLTVTAPRDGEYTLALRCRARLGDSEIAVAVDGAELGACAPGGGDWEWAAVAGSAQLTAGEHEVSLLAGKAGVRVDRVCLMTPEAELPEGIGGVDETAPAMVQGLSATPEGRYAIRLSWEPVRADDLSHYQVYAGTEADFEVGNERLVGSPGDAEFVDWGLDEGTRYFYRVAAVDRAGNASEPCAPISAATDAIDARLFAEIEQRWDWTQDEETTLRFTMPADDEFVVWGLLESLDGKTGATARLALDGRNLGGNPLDLHYICVGHGGPVLETELWDCLRPARPTPDAPPAWQATAGEHELTLRAGGDAKVVFKRFVITNDLGWEPDGRTSFLIK